jgi:hypothetical protein
VSSPPEVGPLYEREWVRQISASPLMKREANLGKTNYEFLHREADAETLLD